MKFNEMRGVVNECINYPHRAKNLINLLLKQLEENQVDNLEKFLLYVKEKGSYLPTREFSQILSRLDYILSYVKDPRSLFHTSNWFFIRLEYLSRFRNENEELNSIMENLCKTFQLENLLQAFHFNNDLYNIIEKEKEFYSKDYVEGQVNIANMHFKHLLIYHSNSLVNLLLVSIVSSILKETNNLENVKLDLETTFRIIDFKLLIK